MISPLYGQISPLRIPTKFARGPVSDSDAISYIAAVESADGSSLEDAVKYVIEDFILGCKSDGIWSAIKASCILAGARTLNGALVPLVGSAPTNFNFVSADYNRETGLLGNGSSKYLNTNRSNNSDPQNSKHLSAFYTISPSRTTDRATLAMTAAAGTGQSQLITNATVNFFRINRSGGGGGVSNSSSFTGLFGASRSNSTTIQTRFNSSSGNISETSFPPGSASIDAFRRGTTNYSDGRMSFYSIGESLDLALLDTRVSTLMTALAAAIP